MRRKAPSLLILTGCFSVILGFIQPWYAKGFSYGGSASSMISGFHLWLGTPSASLLYAPGVVPEFFALLWILPLAVFLISALGIVNLILPQWNNRWFCFGVYTVLLAISGIFLWLAMANLAVQFGLWICLVGWFLILSGFLIGLILSVSGNVVSEPARFSPMQNTRRTALRGLAGIVGLASLGGIGSFLLWETWRTHTSITTYRYTNPASDQTSSGGAPDFNAVLTVDWSSDGQRILVAQLHAPPQSWDALTGKRRQTYQPAEATVAAWSPNGRQIALSQRSFPEHPFLLVLNTITGAQEADLTLEVSQMHGLARFAWSPDSQYLALADADDLTIKLWKPATGEFGKTYTVQPKDQSGFNRLQDLAWSPNGLYLAATVAETDLKPDGTLFSGDDLTSRGFSGIYIWSILSGELVLHYEAEIPPHTDGGSLLSWSPDGMRLAFANKTTVQILDLMLQKLVLTYNGHVLVPTSIAWSPTGKYLASGSADWTVQIWEATTGMLRFLYQGHSAIIYDVDWSPSGDYLVSSSSDGTAQVWQPEL